MIHTDQDFSVVIGAEVDVFLEFSFFSYDPMDVGNLISGSSAFSKSSLNNYRNLLLLNFQSKQLLKCLQELAESLGNPGDLSYLIFLLTSAFTVRG